MQFQDFILKLHDVCGEWGKMLLISGCQMTRTFVKYFNNSQKIGVKYAPKNSPSLLPSHNNNDRQGIKNTYALSI
jgi:hypothetical protein